MKIIFKWVIGFGIFMLIGTAGSSDLNNLTFGQVVLQLFVSLAFITLGYFGLGFTKAKVIRKIKRRRKTKFPQVA
jgi:hypothetical protein